MDRRNFLALIPSISAIPIIGKNIEKKNDGNIVIYQPEEVKTYTKPGYQDLLDFNKCRLQIVYDNRIVAEGYLTSLNIESPVQIHETYEGPVSQQLPMDIHVEGKMFNWHL